jgi:hypothetical protein
LLALKHLALKNLFTAGINGGGFEYVRLKSNTN